MLSSADAIRSIEWKVSGGRTLAANSCGRRPGPSELSYTRGELATFELDVADPDGGLDRDVWWLTQADVILDVIVAVEDRGDEAVSREVALVVGHDPTVVETRTVTVDPGATDRLTLGYETYPTSRDEEFPVRVESEETVFDRVSVEVEA